MKPTISCPTCPSAKSLLICGIVASLLYVGTDISAGSLYVGYSFTSQFISELFAIGAPTSDLVAPLFTVSDVLMVAFALGIWKSAGGNRSLHALSLLFVGMAVNGLILWNFSPMHIRGVESTFTDAMHVALPGLGVGLGLLTLGFGAISFTKGFRFYTIGTILILLLPSIVVFFLYAPLIGSNFEKARCGSDRSLYGECDSSI